MTTGEHIPGSFQKCFLIYLWLGDDVGQFWRGEKAGLAEGEGAEERVGRGKGVTGTDLVSLARLGVDGSPIQALLSKGLGKEDRKKKAATALLWVTSRRHVAAGGSAFDIHCCPPVLLATPLGHKGHFDSLFSIRKG